MDIDSAATPYAGLTPDRMLDALETVGLRGDGRMLALNSYENRVYQFLLEDPVNGMSAVVGRIRECPVFDIRLVVLSHNTIRGAAGAAILNAELMSAQGLLE